MTFGLSLIVKNSAATLSRALEPFRGLADEIVAADTGSSDDTISILEQSGARVVPFEWRDDFAAARNAALDEARADWIFSLDADEFVSRGEAESIVALTRDGSVDAWLFDTMNFSRRSDAGTLPTSGADRDIAPWYFLSTKLRLARRGPRWQGRVHELLEFDALKRGFRVAKAPIVIRHDGTLDGGRPEYYTKLCMIAYEHGEAHAGILNVLALEAVKRKDAATAEKLFREAIAKGPGFASPVVWLGKLLHHTGRSAEAIELLQQGLKTCLGAGEVMGTLMEIHLALGEKDCFRVMAEVAAKLYPGDPYVARALAKGTAVARGGHPATLPH